MKKFLLILTSIVIVFFLIAFFFRDSDISDEEKLAIRTESKAAKLICKKYGMECYGNGGQKNEKLEASFLYFKKKKKVNKEEARELLVNVAVDFLDVINSNEEIRPHLVTYPYGIKNIEVTIIFYSEDGHDVYDPLITAASTSNGRVFFKTDSPENPYQYKNKYEESFEEALRIVHSNQVIN